MKNRLIIALLLVACSLSAQELTLDSCLSLAKQRNCTIRIARLEIDKAQAVKQQMLTKFFPQISGSFLGYHALNHLAGIKPEEGDVDGQKALEALMTDANGNVIDDELGLMKHGFSVSVTAAQPIFAGGRIVNANRYAKMGIEAAEAKAEVTEREVLEEIISSYLLVLGLQEKVATVDAAMALLDSLDHVVAVAGRAGVLEPTDALRLELKKNEMRAKQLQLHNGIRLASRLLCLQVGIDCPESGLTLAPVDDAPLAGFSGERPEFRLLSMQIRSEQFKKKLTIGETLPTIALGGSYFYGDLFTNGSAIQLVRHENQLFRHNGLLFLSASIPLTGWWETSYKIRQHNIAIEQAKLEQNHLTDKLRLQGEKAEADMLEAEALMRSDSAALQMAQENYRLAELNYRAGYQTLTDVLEANALLLQAQNALTDRRIAYLSARRRLHDITGK